MVLGADGTIRLFRNIARAPDVSFTYWHRLPNRKVPSQPIPKLAPDLAVEVLSRRNRKGEMARKLKEYFRSGIRVVWYVYPKTKSVRVFTSLDEVIELGPDDSINGGKVLPGFKLPVKSLFEDVEDEPSTSSRNGKKPSKRR